MELRAILHPGRRRTAVATLACWAGFATLAWWMLSGGSNAFDEAGLRLWREGANGLPGGPGWLLPAMRGVTFFGNAPVRDAIAVVAILALFAMRCRREAALLAFTIAGGAALNSWMKLLFGRARPEFVPWLGEASGLSFPSGHAFNAAVVYLSIALAFRAIRSESLAGTTLVAMAFFLSAAIAFSRVWLGVHYPTDALAGWLGGIGWVLAVRLLAATRPTAQD